MSARPLHLDEVLNRARSVHGNRYDYSNTTYLNQRTPLQIMCRECGQIFKVISHDHFKGVGCQTCHRRRKVNTAEFVRRARQIHGNAYDYSRVEYTHSMKKVIIKCLTCDRWFEQLPNNHINIGNGCQRCAEDLVVSKEEIEWLDELGISVEHRQLSVFADGRRYVVDALVDGIVHEYYGSYWHGDPRCTSPEQLIGRRHKLTAYDVFTRTLRKEEALRRAGHRVKFVWSFDREEGALFSDKHPSIEGWKIA